MTTFLGPVDELPAEGADWNPSASTDVEFCASLFHESGIGFDVSNDGVFVVSNPQESDVFQRWEVDASKDEPHVVWKDDAIEIDLANLFRDPNAFSTLSDASEPEDYVRRFLEV
ncbi:MAG: hypothetical protein AAF236_16535, partial [Verrucomicrobiota bacterium]